jgi:hypothetical protein
MRDTAYDRRCRGTEVSDGRYPDPVNADRDELRRLIEELPDERVPAVLAEAR